MLFPQEIKGRIKFFQVYSGAAVLTISPVTSKRQGDYIHYIFLLKNNEGGRLQDFEVYENCNRTSPSEDVVFIEYDNSDAEIAEVRVVSSKCTTTLVGPHDDIAISIVNGKGKYLGDVNFDISLRNRVDTVLLEHTHDYQISHNFVNRLYNIFRNSL